MKMKIDIQKELDEIFEEYESDLNRWKYKRYAKVIAVLMECNVPWSYKSFLWKNDAKKNWWIGNSVGLQFFNKILSRHTANEQKDVMHYFHDVRLDYDPKDIYTVAETYRAIAEWRVENISLYTWVVATESLRSSLYNALKAAKINVLIDVLWFENILSIRNIWPSKYKLLMEIVNAFAPKNSYNISTWEIELFKKIIWVSERDNPKR